MGLISVGIKVTFLGTKKKFSMAGCLIYCPDPELEHFCLSFDRKNKSTKREMSTLFFILLMDVLTAESLVTRISFFLSFIFMGRWMCGERTELPISWWHCVSLRFFFLLNPK